MTKWIKHNPGDPIPECKVRIRTSTATGSEFESETLRTPADWYWYKYEGPGEGVTHYMPEPKPSLLFRFLRWIKKEH